MSAKDRATRDRQARERNVLAGLADALSSPNGRAFVSVLLENIDAEGEQGFGRRALARDLRDLCRKANWEGLQLLRDENEKPKQRPEAQEEESDE